jgi:hypothetical protein
LTNRYEGTEMSLYGQASVSLGSCTCTLFMYIAYLEVCAFNHRETILEFETRLLETHGSVG